MGHINGLTLSLVIGDSTFSKSKAANLQASVMEPPPMVRMQSALASAYEMYLKTLSHGFARRYQLHLQLANFVPHRALLPPDLKTRNRDTVSLLVTLPRIWKSQETETSDQGSAVPGRERAQASSRMLLCTLNQSDPEGIYFFVI